ncbi:MAG: GNAT family N-acetyltransferase [Dehalococcoidia bacterium]|nr:GNAT family N-acetyltransferase [Dehalococcoidia bacterium]
MDPISNDLTRLTQSGVEEAVRILVEAFEGDPLMDYLFPEHREQPDYLREFFRANLEYAATAGEVYAAPSGNGVSVWLLPGDDGRPVVSKQDDPRLRLKRLYDEEKHRRLSRFRLYFDELHRKLLPGSYFYLMFLGVKKAYQGKGIGSLLVRPLLERADEKKLPCLLDTMNARDLSFYRKHGFEVMLEHRVCGDGPQTWTMLRKPR